MMDNKEPTIIYMVKTDKGCFISDYGDSNESSYTYRYGNTVINSLLFDGEKAEKTYLDKWFFIRQYPERIQIKRSGGYTNERYELMDDYLDLESLKIPRTIPEKEVSDYDSNIIDTMYEYNHDKEPDHLEDFDCKIEILLEIDDYRFAPQIDFEAVHKWSYQDRVYHITNADVKHQMLDRIIFPEVCLHERPCMLSSKEVYDITRQHIISNIDNSVAKISSNYDFCFDVYKLIPLIEPETIVWHNIFAKSKKKREKPKFSTKKYKEVKIFDMTHRSEGYQDYRVIPDLYANNEQELKEKLDNWLEYVITEINRPLCQCPHCKGTGYTEDISKIDFNYKDK